ncbi:MAG: 2-C-methyl-D-erythritol 2,4-cyclodiphosphate synthase [Clostridia bacterium]|nr:2-C-methyl-D-erythritol 2,4-cyclodiphosphate synthase [Clostridia bacterium]
MWSAIVLGGGAGTRMRAGINKVLLPLAGIPVIRRAVEAMAPFAESIVVVCPDAERPQFEAALDGLDADISYASGGNTRQASAWNGLCALPEDCDHVLIHDGARCLTDTETMRAVIRGAEETGAAVASIPCVDTVKSVDQDHYVTGTLDRSNLRCVQTPQAFRRDLIVEAHLAAQRDGFLGTDDASLVERLGHPVLLTEGSRRNLKLTTPEDFAVAEAYLQKENPLPEIRIGSGYDVHRLVPGRKLILCGTDIPYEKGLDGHSDADVAVHALMDALLGAAALGDIGRHFPDTDERYRGISSMKLLAEVIRLLREKGLCAANADVTIVAQAPKLAGYIETMRQNLAEALNLPLDRVNVKATTTERLGFEGRGEGISAQAVAMVTRHKA